MFFSRLMVILEDDIARLMVNEQRGIKTRLDTESDRKTSTTPYNTNTGDVVEFTPDSRDNSVY